MKFRRDATVGYALDLELEHQTRRVDDEIQREVEVVEFGALTCSQAGEFRYSGEGLALQARRE